MKTIKGPAIFLAQFAGDAAPFNNLAAIAGWAAGHGYKGVQIPTWDARLFDLARAAESTVLRRGARRPGGSTAWQLTELSTHLQGQLVAVHPAYDMPSTALRRRRCAAIRRRGRNGRSSSCMLAAQGLAQSGPHGARHLLRRAGLAVSLSVAAAPAGPGRDGVRRTGAALDADPGCLRRSGRRCLLRDPSGRGPARRRHLRDVPRAREQPPALQHPVRSQPLRAAAARLSRLHRHLSRAHPGLPRQGCRVQPDRPAGRLWRLPALGRTGPAGSARSATGRWISARSSPSWRSTVSTAGRCWNGSAASRTAEQGAAEGAPFIARAHHPGRPARLRRFRGQRHRPGRQPPLLGLG